jgi:hypothetical protein
MFGANYFTLSKSKIAKVAQKKRKIILPQVMAFWHDTYGIA